ncbi:MAG: PKD domain-containing protein, partial [Petrotogales bacterium]
AYTYAETHDEQPEHPQYGDYPENIGSNISLNISNQPPEDPQKPSGPEEGVTGVDFTFTTSTTDPEGEQVYYMFDWDDNTSTDWVGPYDSGAMGEASHAWAEPGEYNIKVKAMDINGSESDWSEPLLINIMQAPLMDIGLINGGLFKVSVVIKNMGEVDATEVSWSITLDGGVWIGKETSGTEIIPAFGEKTVNSKLILGFGATTVVVTAEVPEGISDTRSQNGKIFLFIIKVNPGG